jgi:hypothetical protein
VLENKTEMKFKVSDKPLNNTDRLFNDNARQFCDNLDVYLLYTSDEEPEDITTPGKPLRAYLFGWNVGWNVATSQQPYLYFSNVSVCLSVCNLCWTFASTVKHSKIFFSPVRGK